MGGKGCSPWVQGLVHPSYSSYYCCVTNDPEMPQEITVLLCESRTGTEPAGAAGEVGNEWQQQLQLRVIWSCFTHVFGS